MTGRKSGFVTKLTEHCANLVDTGGCICHQGNLLMKEGSKVPVAAQIVTFAELLSNFLDNKPKVTSILKQCEKFLGINRINDLCPTRFLSLFSLVNEACQQFPVVRKIIMLSKDQDLIRLCTKDSFIVHLDQFVVHCAPLYYFPNISLHQCLIMVLELISKLFARLGHSVVLSPASFFRHLYDHGKPKIFPARNKGLQYSIDNPTVQRALDNLDTEAIKNIIVSWNRFIELQLDRLLVRFHTFLSSPIVRYCFLMYKKTAQYTDRSISHLNLLSVAVGLNSANVLDEFTALRMVTASSSLSEELQNQSLNMYPSLKRLVELILIIVPHNMVVEAGFSKMKFSESAYQSNLNSDTYDSMRFVNSHFCRESYDTFRIPPELISLMRKARLEYVKDVKKSVTPQDEEEKETIKVHLGIYERKTSASVAKEINKVDEDLEKAEEAVNALLAKRQRLTVVSEAAQSRENNISNIIIDNMFKQ